MPEDDPTSHKKAHRKEKRKLKRINEGIGELQDALKGEVEPVGSLSGARAAVSPHVQAEEDTTPQSEVTQLAMAADSSHDLGPRFKPLQLQPALGCSEYDAKTHELWLLQLPMDWRFDEEASIGMRKLPGGAFIGHYVDAKGAQFTVREEDASLAAPMYIANTSHEGANLRCNRRITVARDHSAKHEPAEAQVGQSAAPATPEAARKKRRAIHAQTPSKATGDATGVDLQLDDIMAAEASPTGKQGTPADVTPRKKKKKKPERAKEH